MSYIVALAAFGLWAVLTSKLKGKLASKLWFLRPALLLIGSASAANTGVGVWIADHLVAGVLGWAAGMVGIAGALVAGVIVLILAIATALDLKDRSADGIAKMGLIALPILVLAAAGPLAANGAGLFDSIAGLGTSGLSAIVGG